MDVDPYRALLEERFGTVREWVREARRLPHVRELARRRRVLAVSLRVKETNYKEQAA